MSRKYKIRDQSKLYFVTFGVVNWLDVFTRQHYRDMFLDSLKYCQKLKGLELYAYCIMSNHVHLIIGNKGSARLEGIIRDIKKYTAFSIVKEIKDNPLESRRHWLVPMFKLAGNKNPNNVVYQFWQQHSHPIELNTNERMKNCLNYIHENPVKAGIVLAPEDYLYSSAINYAGRAEKLIEVDLIS